MDKKEIDIDEILLPMRYITKLSYRSKIEWAWMANNSVTNHEPKSTLEATKRVVKILDTKYEKADINAVVNEHCRHLTSSNQEKLLKLLIEFEDLFEGTLGDDFREISIKNENSPI